MKVKLLKRLKYFRLVIDNTSLSEKMYIVGVLLLLNALPLMVFSQKYALSSAILGIVVFAGGLVAEGLNIVQKIWGHLYGKVFISIFVAAGSTFSVAFCTSIVAFITSSDPSKFPYTVAMLGFLLIPLFAWLILLFFSLVTFFIQLALFPFFWLLNKMSSSAAFRYVLRKSKPRKERFFLLLMCARAIAFGFLISTLQFLATFDRHYDSFVYAKASEFLYNYEMYPKSHCEKKSPTERFAYINPNLVLVGDKNQAAGYTFLTRPCKS